MQKLVSRMVRLFMVFAAACCIMAGAGEAMSVKAAQTSQVTEAQAADTEDTAQDDGSGVMLLLGGMLIIILAVVITVAATVVVAAPAAADEV
jgi:small-conductance mechanosensitive channel